MIVILAGAPGAGKGTQADLLAEREGFKKVSTGDALRSQIKQDTEVGKLAKGFMDEGKLVPDDVLLRILEAELDANSGSRILLDGYPRNIAQAKTLEGLKRSYPVKAVIHLEVGKEKLIERICGRRTCSQCGSVFHVVYSKPKEDGVCDKCGGTLTQRSDDNDEKVRVRLDVYEKETRPVLEFYRDSGSCFEIDGNRETEVVFEEVSELLKARL